MIHTGDCIEVMAGMPADSVDAVVTDPPYGLEFMGKNWDRFGGDARQRDDPTFTKGDRKYGLVRSGLGQSYGGDARKSLVAFQAWCEAWGREALRITKPGGYLLAFGGTRTHHRLVCGLEDAGWIIRDELDWVYASGFPKGKANLKPAHEPIVLARKPGPLRPLGIDAGRIEAGPYYAATAPSRSKTYKHGTGFTKTTPPMDVSQGRWPSNLLLSDPELFDEPNPYVVGSGATAPGELHDKPASSLFGGEMLGGSRSESVRDTGGYSRFFRVPERYNEQCARCGVDIAVLSSKDGLTADTRSASADVSARAIGSGETAPSVPSAATSSDTPTTLTVPPSAPTSGAEASGSRSEPSSTSATAQSSWSDDDENTPRTPRSKRRATSRGSGPPSFPAKSPDATSPATGTTTTTPSRSMCATCAEAITSPTTSDSDGLPPNYPRYFLVPKSSRADREPVVRGQVPEKEWNGNFDGGGLQHTPIETKSGKTYTTRLPRENAHPTVKPVDLMRHLIRLVTPSGGTVLDPFLGSGSTAIAAELEGFPWIGVEKEPEYVAIAEARLNGVQRGLGLDTPLVGEPRVSRDGVAVRHNSGGNTFGGDKPKPPMPDMTYGRPKPARESEPPPLGMFDEEPAA